MWEFLKDHILNLEWLTVLCTILSFIIPYTIYKVNQALHAYGDPPWKQNENDDK